MMIVTTSQAKPGGFIGNVVYSGKNLGFSECYSHRLLRWNEDCYIIQVAFDTLPKAGFSFPRSSTICRISSISVHGSIKSVEKVKKHKQTKTLVKLNYIVLP